VDVERPLDAERARDDPARPVERPLDERLPLEVERLRPDVERLRPDVERLPDAERLRPDVERPRPDVERLRLDDEVERPRLELERPPVARRRVGRSSCSCAPSSSESPSSPFPISFFATPTAAGIATPSAAPAATFAGVDMPSSSPEVMSSSATFSPPSVL
jgi:hypothetical protein